MRRLDGIERSLAVLACAGLVALSSPLQAGEGEPPISWEVSGTVVDAWGWPVKDASVGFREEGRPLHLFAGATDMKGSYALRVVPNSPRTVRLLQNYPNPFNPTTVVPYDMPAPGFVDLRIYNALGQPVRTLASGFHLDGEYAVAWDGRDDSGVGVAAGLYCCRLRANDRVESRRMVLVDGASASGGVGSGAAAARAHLGESCRRAPAEPSAYSVHITSPSTVPYTAEGILARHDTKHDFTVERIYPRAIFEESEELIVSRVGRDVFESHVFLLSVTPQDDNYRLGFHLQIPNYPETVFVIITDADGQIISEPEKLPDCVANPADCVVIDRETAVQIAREAGLEEGIKAWDAYITWHHGFNAYVWVVSNTMYESSSHGYEARGNSFIIDATSGEILQQGEWLTIS